MFRASFVVCAALVLAVVGVLAAGCKQDGSYELSWSFGPPMPLPDSAAGDGGAAADDAGAPDDAAAGAPGDGAAGAPDDGAAPLEPARSGCAAHGVFAIRITGASTGGDGEDVIVPCSAGSYTRGVPAATWSFAATQLGADGRPKGGSAQVATMANPERQAIGSGQSVELTVVLTPLPACQDGIDNDHDGHVDLDDPDCRGADGQPDPNRLAE
jgi:hypothetical protein